MKALKRKDSTDEKPVWGEVAELGEIRTWVRDSEEPTPFGSDMNMDLLAIVYATPINNIEQYELVDVKLSVHRP